MSKIKVFDNFLPIKLRQDIINYVSSKSDDFAWKTNNLAWDGTMVNKGKQVSILDINVFSDEILPLYLEKDLIAKHLKAHISFHVWARGSYLPFHKDSDYVAASTIYFNEKWDMNDGGLFLHVDDKNEINVIKPEYNRMIFNDNTTPHGVSMIVPDSPDYRLSLQIFFTSS